MTVIWLLFVLSVNCDADGACLARADAAGMHATEAQCSAALAAYGPAPWRISFCVEIVQVGMGS